MKQRSWLTALVSRSALFAERANSRFVALAAGADVWLKRAGRTAADRLLGPTDGAPSAAPADDADEALTRQLRSRLSELHLRVGQGVYQLERARGDDAASVRRQLHALLDEIERLEEVLGASGGAAQQPENRLWSPLDSESERKESC